MAVEKRLLSILDIQEALGAQIKAITNKLNIMTKDEKVQSASMKNEILNTEPKIISVRIDDMKNVEV